MLPVISAPQLHDSLVDILLSERGIPMLLRVKNILELMLNSADSQVEKTRHFLLLREKLGDSIPKSLSDSLSPSLSSGTLSTSTSISSQISTTTFESAVTPSESSGYDSADIESLVDREKELATKVHAAQRTEQVQVVALKMQ